jgi:hypothetical protein
MQHYSLFQKNGNLLAIHIITGKYKRDTRCSAQTNSGTFITINTTPPVVSAGPDYTIPKIHLCFKASVTNSNAGGYTYSWKV